MQSENVEIEDVELTTSVQTSKKEFEKIIKIEKNRENNVKAQNLIKMGCFNQEEKSTVDFTKLEKITYKKLFKAVYDLYEDVDGNLFYIYPKTEGESNKPYGYDVISIETLTDEEYKSLYKASKFEGLGIVKAFNIVSIVAFLISCIITLANVIYNAINSVAFIDSILSLFLNIAFIGIAASSIAISSICFRKYVGK